MIAVDTSVWIAASRTDAAVRTHLRDLIEGDDVLLPVPVRLELLAGIAPPHSGWLRADLDALTQARPTAATWETMEAWCLRAAAAGQAFGFADLLIAALAAESGAPVWSLDRAFERMERLGFIRCYRPRR